MHIEFIVEERSAEEVLKILLPKIIPEPFFENFTYVIHTHKGKNDLLKALPGRLKGYKPWIKDEEGVVVLIDQDEDNCKSLKAQLDKMARDVGLVVKSDAADRPFHVLNRLVIEELEAWFFGDCVAVADAYPGFDPNICKRPRYRNPDAITGGTWEALERELQKIHHYQGGLIKGQVAREIASHMDPIRNRSRSFQVFRDGLIELVQKGRTSVE